MSDPVDSEAKPVGRVSVKAPPFYYASPGLWFRKMESQFVLAGITDPVTKYHHVMAALPEDVALDIPDDEDYAVVKDAVLKRYSKSKTEQIEEALSSLEVVGKPSDFLRSARRKFRECGLKTEDELIKHKLLTSLPPPVRAVMASHESKDLDSFVEIADTIVAVMPHPQYAVSAVQQQNYEYVPRPYRNPGFQQNSFGRGRGGGRFRGNNRVPFNVMPFKPGQKPQVCRAHIYYGQAARTCRDWCTFPSRVPKIPEQQRTPAQSRPGSPQPTSSNSSVV